MVVHISSLTFAGVDIIDVDVQVQISPGLPAFIIVGLADKTIGESKERVRAALASMGLGLPAKKILVNLAPADLMKEGSHFDLPIACGILASMGILPREELQEYLIIGELLLDAAIIAGAGVLPAAMGATARNKGIICPKANGAEAAWSGNDKILAPANLISLVNHFKGSQILSKPEPIYDQTEVTYPDFSDIKGQEHAKRAIEIAAAGGHNLLMSGPPGVGKSMLALRMPGILPAMNVEEILECSTIASIAGLVKEGALTRRRPFRNPHHSCSMAAMVGGGMAKRVKPGEISLAHNGVLFLDELPEFPSAVIESLRQPIEAGEIFISRAGAQIKYPANFQLIAAMNPCKCGYLSDQTKSCSKAPRCGMDYQMKISGPMIDRFDLHIELSNNEDFNFEHSKSGDSTQIIAAMVENARNKQLARYEGYNIKTNSQLEGSLLIEYALPIDNGKELLNEAATKFRLSMRAYNRILKISRTIADLEESTNVKRIHIAEALNYRNFDARN